MAENMDDVGDSHARGSNRVTLRDYLAYYLMVRDDEMWSDHLHQSGGLFQEWIVVKWAKVEEFTLLWARTHQDKIRADSYNAIALAAATHGQDNQTS